MTVTASDSPSDRVVQDFWVSELLELARMEVTCLEVTFTPMMKHTKSNALLVSSSNRLKSNHLSAFWQHFCENHLRRKEVAYDSDTP